MFYDPENCALCPRKCHADRTSGHGYCRVTDELTVARCAPHFWEEPCISGKNGSGAVFFSGCSMGCVFCQNIAISRGNIGQKISVSRFKEICFELKDLGVHNINLVTPSHFASVLAPALADIRNDLKLPIICNCSGYESDEILDLLLPVVDVFLPDLKFYSPEVSKKYANCENYFEVAIHAIRRMVQKTGRPIFDENGLTVPTTWDEMEEVCAKIKEIDPNSIPLGYDSESNWFITMCEQYKSPYTSATGDHYVFNNDQNKAFVKEFREWFQKGYVTTQTIYGAYTSGLFVSTDTTKSYMSIGSSAGATYQRPAKDADGNYPFEVGIATIPQVSADNQKVISQGPSLCIFQKANPQEVIASWLFVKFLTTNVEFQAEFSMASGYVPVIKSVADQPAYAEFLASADGGNFVSALSAKVCIEQESAYYTSPAFNGSSTARDQVGTLLTKCLSGEDGGDVDAMINEAFEDAVAECEYNN